MGFKTCSQDEFDRAMKKFEKINRRNSTQHRELTLAEQIAKLEHLEEERRKQRLAEREQKPAPKMNPFYEVKMKSELAEKTRLEKLNKKTK
jgi:hypothetical protein